MNNQKSPMFIHKHWLNKLDNHEKKQDIPNDDFEIRKQFQSFQKVALSAILSSDIFADKTVVTGGSVLHLFYDIHDRFSVDLDLSLESPILPYEYRRLEAELDDHLESAFSKENYKILNSRLEIRSMNLHNKFLSENVFNPEEILYKYIFQLINLDEYKEIDNHSDYTDEQKQKHWKNKVVLFPNKKKFFEVDFKWEGTVLEKQERKINNYTVLVPSPHILLYKKLVGICAQSPSTECSVPSKFKRARAQDFFDIYSLVKYEKINLKCLIHPKYLSIFKNMIDENSISISSFKKIKTQREFHQSNFNNSVLDMSTDLVKNFDYYFDFVVHLIDYIYPFLSTSNLSTPIHKEILTKLDNI